LATVKDPSSIFNYLHALWIPAFAGMTTFYENINSARREFFRQPFRDLEKFTNFLILQKPIEFIKN